MLSVDPKIAKDIRNMIETKGKKETRTIRTVLLEVKDPLKRRQSGYANNDFMKPFKGASDISFHIF